MTQLHKLLARKLHEQSSTTVHDPIYIKNAKDFLEHVVKSRTPVLVIFFVESQTPKIQIIANDLALELAKRTPLVRLALCNIEERHDQDREISTIVGGYGIRGVPTAILMEYDRIVKYAYIGYRMQVHQIISKVFGNSDDVADD